MTEAYNEYAEALFMLARENGLEKLFSDELSILAETFKENGELLELLCSPAVLKEERLGVIDSVFEGRLHEYIVSFLKLLCERGRIKDIIFCCDEYDKLYKASMNTVSAKVTSAYPLNDSEKKKLISKLQKISNKTVVPEYVIDESLLGGVTVDMEGKLLDGSLRTRLKEVKEVIDR